MGGQLNIHNIDPNSALIEYNKNVNSLTLVYDYMTNVDYGHIVREQTVFHKYDVDFIQCLDYIPQHQVVYVHDPVHRNAGFYYCYHVQRGILQLIDCDNNEFCPIRVDFSGKFSVKFESVMFEPEDIHYLPKLIKIM